MVQKRSAKKSVKAKKRSPVKVKPSTVPKARKAAFIIRKVRGPFAIMAAVPTVSVTVTRTLTGGASLDALLNDSRLAFNSTDEAHAIVGLGQAVLEWIVVGPPGSSYTIAVTKPPRTPCGDPSVNGGTLDGSGRDDGSCEFTA
jgi:hypothetical protein